MTIRLEWLIDHSVYSAYSSNINIEQSSTRVLWWNWKKVFNQQTIEIENSCCELTSAWNISRTKGKFMNDQIIGKIAATILQASHRVY